MSHSESCLDRIFPVLYLKEGCTAWKALLRARIDTSMRSSRGEDIVGGALVAG